MLEFMRGHSKGKMTLIGVVHSSDGEPIARARASAKVGGDGAHTGDSRVLGVVYTGPDGGFRIDVPEGLVAIEIGVQATGHYSLTTDVSLEDSTASKAVNLGVIALTRR